MSKSAVDKADRCRRDISIEWNGDGDGRERRGSGSFFFSSASKLRSPRKGKKQGKANPLP